MLAFRILSEAGPDGSLSWLLLWALGFFFLIIVVGWAASGTKGSGREAREHPHKVVDEPIKGEAKGPKLKLKKKQRK